MTDSCEINYGPLKALIGIWEGDKGMDLAPDPDGSEDNPYYESIEFEAIGDVTNAEAQVLVALRYYQVVRRKSDNKVFHNETGYWMWDSATDVIMHSLAIPRGVCVLAGGQCSAPDNDTDPVDIEVIASADNPDWGILQSPFMQNKARTTRFTHQLSVANGVLRYSETTIIDIYGNTFEHRDQNELVLQT